MATTVRMLVEKWRMDGRRGLKGYTYCYATSHVVSCGAADFNFRFNFTFTLWDATFTLQIGVHENVTTSIKWKKGINFIAVWAMILFYAPYSITVSKFPNNFPIIQIQTNSDYSTFVSTWIIGNVLILFSKSIITRWKTLLCSFHSTDKKRLRA